MTRSEAEQIGDQLKHLRLKAGLSQAGIAEAAGINTNAYAKIERGESEPTIGTLKKLAQALGVSVTNIVGV